VSPRRRRDRGRERVGRSWLGVRDLMAEAMASVLARPTRTALTALGTVLGIGALVATAGLTNTAGQQIISRFDALAATEVVVTPGDSGGGGGEAQADAGLAAPSRNVLPWDAEERVATMNGVVAAGTLTELDVDGRQVRTVPVVDPLGGSEVQVDFVAASPGLLDALRGTIGSGRWFDAGHDARADRVAVVGRGAAERLGLAPLDRQPALFLDDVPLTVIGIVDDVEREPSILDAVIVPDGTARQLVDLDAPGEVHIDTDLGGAGVVGAQVPLALAPQAPDELSVRVPPDPEEVRASVADDVRALFLLLGALSLIIGGLGIANTTLVGVLERTGEIGLRRSLGAYRAHIAAQFLMESTTTGLLGGIVGTALGIVVIVAVSALKVWTPVLEPVVPLLAVGAGAGIGLAAGTYPAWRAANTEPIAALRTE
jgi:ABC-type antimicrobial peptide transport system permease subunit